jgi:hypothetical protein
MIFGLLGIFTYPNPKIKISHIAICMLITSIAAIAYIIIDNYSAIQENVSNIYDYREKIVGDEVLKEDTEFVTA